jgi:TonB family protein
MKRLFGAFFAGFLCFSAVLETHAASPNTASAGQAIAEKLIGKPLFLRGFWASDSLKFNADGQPATTQQKLPLTESGIDVRSVHVENGTLVIEGQRMALVFLPDEQIRRVAARTDQYTGAIRLEIQGDTSGDYGKALETIFASDLADLTPSLPPYWQSYAAKHFTGANGPPTLRQDVSAPAAEEKAMHVGGEVQPPTLLRTYNPKFTELATAQKFNGDVKLYLWFNSDGTVSHVSVAKPAGLGLDEAAVAAVKKYQFAPATRGGDAVTVDLYLNVSFESLAQGW